MSLNPSATLVDAGIDYIRLTSQDRQRQQQMLEVFRKIALRDAQLGFKTTTGGAFGFVGKKTRHALWGLKKDWALLQVTGYEAKGAFRLAQSGIQASRIDLQLTFRVGENNVQETLRSAYDLACDYVRAKSRPVKVNLIESRHIAQTVYIGSRASDVFFRIYDKFAESGKEEYRGCVRFEVELKGRQAKAIWAACADGSLTLHRMLAMVITLFAERGVTLPVSELEAMEPIRWHKEPTSQEDTLAWLRRQVVPTIRKLAGESGWYLPFAVLFEDVLTATRKCRILHLMGLGYGG